MKTVFKITCILQRYPDQTKRPSEDYMTKTRVYIISFNFGWKYRGRTIPTSKGKAGTLKSLALLAGAVEYTNCISAEG